MIHIPIVPFALSLTSKRVNLISVAVPSHSLPGRSSSTSGSDGVLSFYPTGLFFFCAFRAFFGDGFTLRLDKFSLFPNLDVRKLILHFHISVILYLDFLLL